MGTDYADTVPDRSHSLKLTVSLGTVSESIAIEHFSVYTTRGGERTWVFDIICSLPNEQKNQNLVKKIKSDERVTCLFSHEDGRTALLHGTPYGYMTQSDSISFHIQSYSENDSGDISILF